MSHPTDRDIDKIYPRQEFVAKLRRLADALETGKRFEISIGGEKIRVPAGAVASVEHERGDSEEEIEFQLRWSREVAGDESASGD
ncbi:amphi-Trp domain-containing protein [Mesorhizobium loti]|nr:amphi-Trp domain-containing protein [Mesorhizobium loti]PLP56737.1 amphi-Trp domain-containing protein [Mesorhizobium loti]